MLSFTCVFGSFTIHRPRSRSPLPAKLWLARVSMIRRLSLARIRTSRAHWSGRVVRVCWIRLLHVHRVSLLRITLGWVALWRWALGWVAWSSRATARVWRRLLKIHVWVEKSPENKKIGFMVHIMGLLSFLLVCKVDILKTNRRCASYVLINTSSNIKQQVNSKYCRTIPGTNVTYHISESSHTCPFFLHILGLLNGYLVEVATLVVASGGRINKIQVQKAKIKHFLVLQ